MDLHDVLDRATEAVEAPGLANRVLVEARRRRTRARGYAAGLVAAVAVLVLVVCVRVVATGPAGEERPEGPVAPTPPERPSVPTVDVQPRWDPRTVDELPAAPDDLLPLLPDVLDVPTSSPALAEDPVDAAVLTVGRGDAVKLLGVDGRWRHVPPPVTNGSVELTRDGRRLLVATETGVDVWDLARASVTSLPLPPGRQPLDETRWQWLDDATLLLDGRWSVDARTGAARVVRDPAGPYEVDDAGAIYEFAWDGPLTLLQVRGDTVVGVGWSRRYGLSVSVTDRETSRARTVLPVEDDGRTTYGNGGLSVQAVLADGTVLLRVLVRSGSGATVRFVAWEPGSGELFLVMRTLDVLPSWSVSTDLLG